MTALEYYRAARKMMMYGNLLCGITGFLILAMLICATDSFSDDPIALGTRLDQRIGETAAGLVAPVVFGIVFLSTVPAAVLPAIWLDRKIGRRCPHCRKSVTLRCHWREVLQSGVCQLCGGDLFPVDTELVAATAEKPLNATALVWWATGVSFTALFAACVIRHPVTIEFFVPAALLASWVGTGTALYALVRTPSRKLWLATVGALVAAALAAIPYWYEATGHSFFPEGSPAWPRISMIESRPSLDTLPSYSPATPHMIVHA